MAKRVIRVEKIGKKYHIGGPKPKNQSFREMMMEKMAAPFKRTRDLLRGHATGAAELHHEIWALDEITFGVEEGEVIGIIGRNGAGKSTLLKVLSRITEPTRGYAEIHGRVGSLLEVGTGFHQELTGRENIYLNGAILGMRRTEIERKFEEIVDFSGVEKFIDTPVKHYSSGMTVRLAFAVAAHLEPEILIVDEVLAVGDASFQRKCINKMQDVGQEGRTVLFVSHNMSAISRLCQRGILLEEGKILIDAAVDEVVRTYLDAGVGTMAGQEWSDPRKAPQGEVVRLKGVYVRDEGGEIGDVIDIRKPVSLEMAYEVLEGGHILMPHFQMTNEEGVGLFTTIDLDPEWRHRRREKGHYVSRAVVPGNYLAEGTLFVHAHMATMNPRFHQFSVPDAVAFQVVDSPDGDSARGDWAGNLRGVVRPLLEWQTDVISNGSGSVG